MKYTDEYRRPALVRQFIGDILGLDGDQVRIMEFCGGHTHAIMRFGLRQALSPRVRMLSGPGCPVCVTANDDIDQAIALAQLPDVTVATFGDMIRVPGTRASLQEARAAGADVRIVYSALDALDLARSEPKRSVIMLGIGFETTAPTVAASVVQAKESDLHNYYVYSMHKLTPPAMRAILDAGEVRVDAVLGPGHVTAITGWHAWEFLAEEYRIPCSVSGFEPVDMLRAIQRLVEARREDRPTVTNAYSRGVSAEGNLVAQTLMAKVFDVTEASWRGLGQIPQSGLSLRREFSAHDAHLAFDTPAIPSEASVSAHQRGCRCGEVLRGVIEPPECALFGQLCTPARPIGPCMVSAEGACAAYYRYGGALDG